MRETHVDTEVTWCLTGGVPCNARNLDFVESRADPL